MYAMARLRCLIHVIGLHDHAFSEKMQGAARFSAFTRCRDQTLVGKLHIALLDSLARFDSTPKPSPPVTRPSPYLRASFLVSAAAVHIQHLSPHFFRSLSSSTLSIPSFTVPLFFHSPSSQSSLETSAKFCSTPFRHPHASIDGLHTQSFLHCLLNQPAHTRAQFSRHVLHHRLYHLRHNRES